MTWADAVIGSGMKHALCPDLSKEGPGFRGVRIHALGEVVTPASGLVVAPMCISFAGPATLVERSLDIDEELTLVAIEARTGRASIATLGQGGVPVPGPPGPSDVPDEELAQRTSRRYLTVDLARHAPMSAPGIYFVHVLFDAWASNVERVHIGPAQAPATSLGDRMMQRARDRGR